MKRYRHPEQWMRNDKPIFKSYEPPYRITPAVLSLVEMIGEHLG